jgi:hypothetical protein
MTTQRASRPEEPVAEVGPAVLLVRADGLILGATDEAKTLLGLDALTGRRLQELVADGPGRVLEVLLGGGSETTPYGAVLSSLMFRRPGGPISRCIVRVSRGVGTSPDGQVWRRLEIRAPGGSQTARR